jgi:hypothetical protein
MDLLNFIFRLGVVFAIFGFLFGLFEFGLTLLRGIRPKTIAEEYAIKGIKYLFLVDVTFLFCLDLSGEQISMYNLIMAIFVLLTYFIGKFQNRQQQLVMFQMMGNQMGKKQTTFNLKAEIAVIGLAVGLFVLFVFFPEYASNPASLWFHESIMDIEDTPVFGFIFKVIGFFFLVSMIIKMINAFGLLLTGRPFMQMRSGFKQGGQQKEKKDDEFDDYEELN